jgi:hypothetical protein
LKIANPTDGSIWTHNLKGVNFTDTFQPNSCPSNSSTFQWAVTIAAGEQDHNVYEQLSKKNAICVGGSNPVSVIES